VSQTEVKERPDEIQCRGGRWILDLRSHYSRTHGDLVCDTCNRVQLPEDGSKPLVGDACPSNGKRKELYIRRIEHYQWAGTYKRLRELEESATPVRVKRSSGEWTKCRVEGGSYYHACVKWTRESDGKNLQKMVDIDLFVEQNPSHFADLEEPQGPKE
jgi:hypothetical protein